MHIPNYSPLYQVTQQKNGAKWDLEQQQVFEQITWEIIHAIALGPVWAGQDVRNVLFAAARETDPTWNLWQKAAGETWGQPHSLWSQGYRRSKACYIPAEKEIIAPYEGVWAASEGIGTEAELFLAPWLALLDWMFKWRVSSALQTTDATWN